VQGGLGRSPDWTGQLNNEGEAWRHIGRNSKKKRGGGTQKKARMESVLVQKFGGLWGALRPGEGKGDEGLHSKG